MTGAKESVRSIRVKTNHPPVITDQPTNQPTNQQQNVRHCSQDCPTGDSPRLAQG